VSGGAPPANAALITALLTAGLYDDAVFELRRAAETGGTSPVIEATIAYALNRRGDLRAAITTMRRAYPQFMAEGGEGLPPAEAIAWVENAELLAEQGDRPAMLDVAFALGYGRALKQDRARAVETYLKAMAQSVGEDELSLRIRHAAARGITAMLNRIVEQKDLDAVIIATLLGGAVVLGFTPLEGRDTGSVLGIAAILGLDLGCSVIAALKGKYTAAVVGILVPLVGLVAAIRIAKPGSPWAKRRYGRGSPKLARATARNARGRERYRRWQDRIGGAPTPLEPPDRGA
jgi:tetratricopeptide (TPR) repeat protein